MSTTIDGFGLWSGDILAEARTKTLARLSASRDACPTNQRQAGTLALLESTSSGACSTHYAVVGRCPCAKNHSELRSRRRFSTIFVSSSLVLASLPILPTMIGATAHLERDRQERARGLGRPLRCDLSPSPPFPCGKGGTDSKSTAAARKAEQNLQIELNKGRCFRSLVLIIKNSISSYGGRRVSP
jgi:hypothetical protein